MTSRRLRHPRLGRLRRLLPHPIHHHLWDPRRCCHRFLPSPRSRPFPRRHRCRSRHDRRRGRGARVKATSNNSRDSSAVAADAAAATRALYETYSQRVFTFCVSRLRDPEEAQDAAQTTFIYAMRALDKGVEPRFELAWLLAIAQNVCRSTRRSLARHDARTSHMDVTELEAAAASMHAETGEEVVRLRDSLERLPENQRRAILLREWQGLSYADIAAELHLSLAAVEALVFRARRTLAAQIERARFGSSSATHVTASPPRGSLPESGLPRRSAPSRGQGSPITPPSRLERASRRRSRPRALPPGRGRAERARCVRSRPVPRRPPSRAGKGRPP